MMILGLTGVFWQRMWMGSSVGQYVLAVGIFVLLLVLVRFLKALLLRAVVPLVRSSSNRLDDRAITIVDAIRPPFYVLVALYVSTRVLTLEGSLEVSVQWVLLFLLTWQVVYSFQALAGYLIDSRLVDQDDRSTEVVSSILRVLSKVVLWSLGFLFVVSNLGFDVTSLLTGLGIGGLAVALAVQNVLGDLFSSLAIYFDKPFAPGDFIKTEDVTGTVEKVGIKTTRVKALSGEEVVLSNAQLTGARIHNYRRMTRKRVAFALGVEYGTEQAKLRAIPEWVEEIISSVSDVTFSRAHLHGLGDSSLNFEVVYFVESREYSLYMDIHQKVLMGIYEKFMAEKVMLAFPTQTVWVKKPVA